MNIARTASKPLGPTSGADGRWIAQNTIAYMQVRSFVTPVTEEKALALIDQFKAARTLIVDVRHNAGGMAPRNLLKDVKSLFKLADGGSSA